jgi:hypothetical protein
VSESLTDTCFSHCNSLRMAATSDCINLHAPQARTVSISPVGWAILVLLRLPIGGVPAGEKTTPGHVWSVSNLMCDEKRVHFSKVVVDLVLRSTVLQLHPDNMKA